MSIQMFSPHPNQRPTRTTQTRSGFMLNGWWWTRMDWLLMRLHVLGLPIHPHSGTKNIWLVSRPSVHLSVCPSVCLFVCQLIDQNTLMWKLSIWAQTHNINRQIYFFYWCNNLERWFGSAEPGLRLKLGSWRAKPSKPDFLNIHLTSTH